MDKSTLSNYGWIVIAVLVLSVMIALATPFGTYIENGVRSATQGLFDTSEKAMNVVGMTAGEGNFENGYQGVGDSSKPETPKVEGSATFSDGATLTWDELKLAENGAMYGYDASAITDTKIGDYAFQDCYSLTRITIPNSVTSIGQYAFNETEITSITIPDSVTSIGHSAFSNCYLLKNITIPDSVTSIGPLAFFSCNALTSITIPDSVTSIGESAFGLCWSLTSITIPDSVTSIGNSTFYFCDALTSITIPDSVTSIGESAFSDCYSLTRITIPEGVTSIGDYAFSSCPLANITYGGTTEQWNNCITFGVDWNNSIPATQVNCSDGIVPLT